MRKHTNLLCLAVLVSLFQNCGNYNTNTIDTFVNTMSSEETQNGGLDVNAIDINDIETDGSDPNQDTVDSHGPPPPSKTDFQSDPPRRSSHTSGPSFGIFYALWHCPYSADTIDNPPDITRIEEIRDPNRKIAEYTSYLRKGLDLFWQDKPLQGYYCLGGGAKGRAVLRAHARQLRDAGVDFIFADFTNNAISYQAIDPKNPNNCRRTYHRHLISGHIVSSCMGLDTSQRTESIVRSFKALLEEWSKIPGAPKVVPWVPITRYNMPGFLFAKGGHLKHRHRLTIQDVFEAIRGSGTSTDWQYKDLLLQVGTPQGAKPLLFNTVNHIFPFDQSEVNAWQSRGFSIQPMWARFPTKQELAIEKPYALETLGRKSVVNMNYESLLLSALRKELKGLISPNATFEATLRQISRLAPAKKSIFFSKGNLALKRVNEFYWHTFDVDKVWRWRAPCRNPRQFKLSRGSTPCNQRFSINNRVANVSSAFEWVSFSEANTSVPQFRGETLKRYFDKVKQHKNSIDFVLIDSWNEWVSPFRRCSPGSGRALVSQSSLRIQSMPPPRLLNDNRNEQAVNHFRSNFSPIPPVLYWTRPAFEGSNSPRAIRGSRIQTLCQSLTQQTSVQGTKRAHYRWLSINGQLRARPHFHHHWTGEYRSDIEPGEHSGWGLFNVLKRQIAETREL